MLVVLFCGSNSGVDDLATSSRRKQFCNNPPAALVAVFCSGNAAPPVALVVVFCGGIAAPPAALTTLPRPCRIVVILWRTLPHRRYFMPAFCQRKKINWRQCFMVPGSFFKCRSMPVTICRRKMTIKPALSQKLWRSVSESWWQSVSGRWWHPEAGGGGDWSHFCTQKDAGYLTPPPPGFLYFLFLRQGNSCQC